jgi:hypothetical protein
MAATVPYPYPGKARKLDPNTFWSAAVALVCTFIIILMIVAMVLFPSIVAGG